MAEIILIENDIKSFQKPMEAEMENPLKHFERELVKIRTGRAHTSMIEDIPVVAYGLDPVPLKGLGVVAAPDARLLTVQPWDVSIIPDIEKAIAASGIGISPVNDGKIIRLRLPEMSSDRREELIKMLHKKLEECRVAIRNVRKDFKNLITDAKKDKKVSENFHNRLADLLQEITDNYIGKAESLAKKKEIELATV
ncbi:MAG TPA: ribosome recycling factor [Candidatus Babeliales bacterium]|jgi:ribosome recycling factor|nr:ribosome recycling factor [Candidatus Babeliales bacterium]